MYYIKHCSKKKYTKTQKLTNFILQIIKLYIYLHTILNKVKLNVMNEQKVIEIVNNEVVRQLERGNIACEHGEYICIDMYNDTIIFDGSLKEVSLRECRYCEEVTFRAEGKIQCYNGNTEKETLIDFESDDYTIEFVTDEYGYNGVSRYDFY